ncbi:MAG: hypothetical protein EBY17_31475, partial [Acidobacteriia bacterium]|nr:hypothetical protein [Terriglobia bacterium]
LHVEIRETHQFVRTGPFRWMRHPTYFSMILELLSAAFILQAPATLMVRVSGECDPLYAIRRAGDRHRPACAIGVVLLHVQRHGHRHCFGTFAQVVRQVLSSRQSPQPGGRRLWPGAGNRDGIGCSVWSSDRSRQSTWSGQQLPRPYSRECRRIESCGNSRYGNCWLNETNPSGNPKVPLTLLKSATATLAHRRGSHGI